MSETIIKGVKNKLKMYQHVPGLMLERYEICSLINTIESQKEKMDQQHADYLALSQLNIDTITGARELEKQVESQKEEIENKRDLILTSNKMYTEISLRESDLNDEIDRLKAITELAVKENDRWNSLRPEVQWFAEQMEATLKRHDQKGGWGPEQCNMNFLLEALKEEVTELSIATGYIGDNVRDIIIRKCTNVANYAMMNADRMKLLNDEDLKITIEIERLSCTDLT